MARTVGIGHQDFETLILSNNFYIDKTILIKEWWESGDVVTLITRPRRFGKTLNMSMLEKFFSCRYAGRGDLFEGLAIWEEKAYRDLQGTFPVINISFANAKERNFQGAKHSISQILEDIYNKNVFLLEGDLLTEHEKSYFRSVSRGMEETTAVWAIHKMSDFLSRYYGKKVVLFLDEYDTPMQEAYAGGYWEEMAGFIRSLLNASFKTNPYLERAMMTGITRISKESIFSDLNNLEVVTASSGKYGADFGFTEQEVFAALEEFGLSGQKQEVKEWYDGFTFGEWKDIYNPWSIINFISAGELAPYWANTSSNQLAGQLIREGSQGIKQEFEKLLNGAAITTELDEQIVYSQLGRDEQAIWSLLLAGGYLKVSHYEVFTDEFGNWSPRYTLELTNFEVKVMFRKMVRGWFVPAAREYNALVQALLLDDVKAMNLYMNKVSAEMFSYFDTGKKPSEDEPERFYHGFVLGLMVELSDRYIITSNRESGFGRYDVMLEPRKQEDGAIILEFKVQDLEREKTLSDTVTAAVEQIRKKDYAASLYAKGIPKEKIRNYGFAFCGKKVLVGKGNA